MNRIRLYDAQLSELPSILGLTQGNVPAIARAVNRAQERLLYSEEANEEGWIGGWAEMAFSVSKKNPYITCPRGVARLEAIDICGRAVPLRNQFAEYMQFGDGRMPRQGRWLRRRELWNCGGFTRNHACTMQDITNPPQYIQVFAVNPADVIPNPQTNAIPRVFLQGLDQNGRIVTSMDNGRVVQGEFVTLAEPYVMSVNQYSCLTGVQKDCTQGEVQIFQSDPQWGIAEILSTMEPTETTGWYRRYFLNGIPRGCCPAFRPIQVNQTTTPTCPCPYEEKEWVMVTALAKLDLIPVAAPTDYLLIQSIEAIIAECQAIRFSKMDDPAMQTKEAAYHAKAIKILRGQGYHEEGKNTPAVLFKPFGNAGLNRLHLGMT